MNKTFLRLLAWCALLVLASARGDETVTIRTIAGRVYENAKVSRVLPDGIVLAHPAGVTTVSFSDLPLEVRERYGYDPEAAAKAVADRQAGEAARRQADSQRQAQARARMEAETAADAAAADAAKIVTADQMKNYWLNTFPKPKSLDKDFHQKKREYDQLVQLIRAGKLDNQAQREALSRNIAECQRAGDLGRAASFQADLAKLDARIAEEKRARAASQLQHELHMLNHAVRQLNEARMLSW
jgi:hypothetical protein